MFQNMVTPVRSSGGGTYTSIASAVPAMTSNTTPTGYVASASSVYSGNYDAYKAFNEDETGFAPNTESSNQWIKIEFPTETFIFAAALRALSGTGNANPTVYGSNDDVNYTELLNTLPMTNVKTIFETVGSYKYYKIIATRGWSTSGSGYKIYLYTMI